MRRILARLTPLLLVAGVLVPAAGPAVAVHAATPDIVCKGAQWWYDSQTGLYINDGLPSGDYYPGGALPVPAEEPRWPPANYTIQICYDNPPDGIYYLRNNQVGPANNAMGVQLVRNPTTGKPQGPELGYNASLECGEWYGWCPIVSGEYPFSAVSEWREICLPGYPGHVAFQSYYTGLYLNPGANVFWEDPNAPGWEQSGEYYEGAGIGQNATFYVIPGECGSNG